MQKEGHHSAVFTATLRRTMPHDAPCCEASEAWGNIGALLEGHEFVQTEVLKLR